MSKLDKFLNNYAEGRQAADQLLIRFADDSPCSLEDWRSALEFFLEWLESRGETSDLKTMLGYLECCVDSQSGMSGAIDLRANLQEMLDDYGFQGSTLN